MQQTLNSAQNDVNSGVCRHGLAELTHFERERRLLKRLLHGAPPKRTQVSASLCRRAVRVLLCQLGKRLLALNYLLSICCKKANCRSLAQQLKHLFINLDLGLMYSGYETFVADKSTWVREREIKIGNGGCKRYHYQMDVFTDYVFLSYLGLRSMNHHSEIFWVIKFV